jgi:hypothetical protein
MDAKTSWLAALVLFAVGLGCLRRSGIDEKATSEPIGEGDQGVSPACAPMYPKDWRPVVGLDKQPPAQAPKPERGKPFADAAYKTCVVRVTDHAADGVPGFARNDYSRRQAFNADDTRLVVAAEDGTWHIYDVAARRHIGRLPDVSGDAEPQWHPTKPNVLYYFPAFGVGMQIRELDVVTGKSRVVADLATRIRAIWPRANSAWTKSEGSPSSDARYWGLMVDDADWNGLGLVTYDLAADEIIATYDFARNGKTRPDHVSMSPSGQWMVVSWNEGTYAFSRDLTNPRQLHHKSEHSDIAIGADGEDTYVSIDYDKRGGPVFMTNLKTGKRTDLFLLHLEGSATAIHFSGKAYKKPGWVLVSTYADTGRWQWMHRKVFAAELKELPSIVHLAHTHAEHKDYFTEPHASVNRDFTRVVFGSNWESVPAKDIDTYLIEVPRAAIGARR